jgi:hypothetical protein
MIGDGHLLPVARSMSQDLLDLLFWMHQKGRLTVPRIGSHTSWSFDCALERIWASYAAVRETSHIGICKYCGKAFLKWRANQEYCPDPRTGETTCKVRRSNALKDQNKGRKAAILKQVKKHVGECFSARDIYWDLDGRYDLDTIQRLLDRMSEDASTGLVPYGRDENWSVTYRLS